MGRRRQARELALQALYLADAARMSAEEAFQVVSLGALDEKGELFARGLTLGTAERLAELDALIQKVAQNWEVARMACVDRNLLRMASYELLHCPDTPVSVVIDEALEIGKKYSSEDSSRFLNGILDKVKDGREDPAAG
ncbi:MAG TPA: transcription antitermination factor NusB [Elusimicrobia bacterium]|nr:transcription antitermination factor NusB [Elusimicrobiota bacterium]